LIAWHVYPLGFAGLPIRPEASGTGEADRGDGIGQLPGKPFEHLANWLVYAAALGFEALSLGPPAGPIVGLLDKLRVYWEPDFG
jgi:hypothetical protein